MEKLEGGLADGAESRPLIVGDAVVEGLAIVVRGTHDERKGLGNVRVVGVLLGVIENALAEKTRGIRKSFESREF